MEQLTFVFDNDFATKNVSSSALNMQEYKGNETILNNLIYTLKKYKELKKKREKIIDETTYSKRCEVN